MELNNKNTKRLLFLITFTILFYWGITNLSTVGLLFQKLFSVLTPFLLGLCFAFVINILLRPIEGLWDSLSARRKRPSSLLSKIKRPVCLIISTLLILGVIFVLLFMIVPEVQRTIAHMSETFPAYLANVEGWWTGLSSFLEPYGIILPETNWNLSEFTKRIGEFFSVSGSAFLGKTVEITSSIFSGIFNVVLGLVFSFYVLAQKESLGNSGRKILLSFLPEKRVNRILTVAALTNKTFTSFVTGQLTEAVIMGVLCFLGMLVFSMPYALMISALVGFIALIPVFGAFIGTAIGAIFIVMVDPMKAFWFVLFIIVLQQLEGNIIYPRVVGKSVGLPGIWVLTAVTIGGGLFGVLGILLSVPICAVLYYLIKETVAIRLNKKHNMQKKA